MWYGVCSFFLGAGKCPPPLPEPDSTANAKSWPEVRVLPRVASSNHVTVKAHPSEMGTPGRWQV